MGNHFLTLSLLLVTVCVCVSFITTKLNPKEAIVSVSSDSEIPTEIHGVKILRQASDTKLAQLGVASWPKSVTFSISLLLCFNGVDTEPLVVLLVLIQSEDSHP